MKSNEHYRMEAYYHRYMPAEFRPFLTWAVDASGNYLTEFARLCWGAWQEAQRAR